MLECPCSDIYELWGESAVQNSTNHSTVYGIIDNCNHLSVFIHMQTRKLLKEVIVVSEQ